MDSILQQLGHIVLYGLPTFFLILFLNFYLKQMFFRPMAEVLAKRYELTEGERMAADESLRKAEERISEYQQKVRAARGEVYAEQELAHRKLSDEQSAAIEAAHKHWGDLVQQKKLDLASDTKAALETLSSRSEELAERISQRILQGKAA